jgi:hypothetical protein
MIQKSTPVDYANTMRIYIKTMNNTTHGLSVEPTNTVWSLKRSLDSLFSNTPNTEYHILYAGKLLKNPNILADYNVVEDATLFVMEQCVNEYAPIVLTLQKHNTLDDLLIVVPDNITDHYNVFFLQKSIENGHILRIQNETFPFYMTNFFRTLWFDVNGCSHLQIDFPGYPTIVVDRPNFEAYCAHFLRQFESIQDDWPLEFRNVTRAQ